MNSRRRFIGLAAGLLVAAPVVSSAQPATKVSRIGYLRRTSLQPVDIEELRHGLRELGYVEGRNLIIDERYANGDASRLPLLARELLQLKVQVLVVDGGATLAAVREFVGATPIVFAVVGNPVNAGFVKSLDRPGGTMTGLTNFSGELVPKRLQLLHEILPAKRVGVMSNPVNPSPLGHERLRAAARSLEIELTFAEAQTPAELAAAVAKLSQAGVTEVAIGMRGCHGLCVQRNRRRRRPLRLEGLAIFRFKVSQKFRYTAPRLGKLKKISRRKIVFETMKWLIVEKGCNWLLPVCSQLAGFHGAHQPLHGGRN